MAIYIYLGAAVCVVIAVVLVVLAVRKGKLRRAIAATDTTPISEAREGQRAELKGVVQTNSPIEAPYCQTPCVYYRYELKQKEPRKNQKSGRTTYHWRTLDSGTNQAPFVLQDNSGAIAVYPDDATVEARKLVDSYVKPGQHAAIGEMNDGMLKQLVGAAAMVGGMQLRQKVAVWGIPVGQPLYVLGDVQRDAQGRLAVAYNEEQLLLSTQTEEELLRSYGRQLIGFYAGAAALIAGAIGLAAYAAVAAP